MMWLNVVTLFYTFILILVYNRWGSHLAMTDSLPSELIRMKYSEVV